VPGETFLWLVYQYVLPKGFRRIRDYGYLNGNAKKTLVDIQRALGIMVARLPELIRPTYPCHTAIPVLRLNIMFFAMENAWLLRVSGPCGGWFRCSGGAGWNN